MPEAVLPVGDLLVWEVVSDSALVNYAYRMRWHPAYDAHMFFEELP